MNEEKFIQEILTEYYKRIGKKHLYLIGQLKDNELEQLKSSYYVVKQMQESVDLMLLTKLSVSSMVHVALLYGETKEERTILDLLHQKKKVYVLKSGLEYRCYKQTAYRLLYMQYQEYEQRLRHFGIDFIDSYKEIVGKKGGDFI